MDMVGLNVFFTYEFSLPALAPAASQQSQTKHIRLPTDAVVAAMMRKQLRRLSLHAYSRAFLPSDHLASSIAAESSQFAQLQSSVCHFRGERLRSPFTCAFVQLHDLPESYERFA